MGHLIFSIFISNITILSVSYFDQSETLAPAIEKKIDAVDIRRSVETKVVSKVHDVPSGITY